MKNTTQQFEQYFQACLACDILLLCYSRLHV